MSGKVEKILKGCLDSIPSPSPSLKIQIMGGKVCLKCKGKTSLAFVIAQFAYYACLPYLLKMASATALNLSLLATDYYTVVAGMVFFNYKVLFWVLSVPKVILLQAAEFFFQGR